MRTIPQPVADFLTSKRIAVAGVSRSKAQAANAVFDKLRKCGYDAIPVNPNAAEIDGVRCYPDLASIPGTVDGLVFAAHPAVASQLVRQCAERGIQRIWFHRSFGTGSVSEAAVKECADRHITPIVGGCPLMYCEPVDIFHRCACWWLKRRGRVPA